MTMMRWKVSFATALMLLIMDGNIELVSSSSSSNHTTYSPVVTPVFAPVFPPVNETETAKSSSASSKPNILLIMADDVGTGDIPFYWNSGLVKMPNIQRLANAGVTFMRAHATPLCAPSRYSLLSGNYQHRGRTPGGTWTIDGEGNQFAFSQKSIAWVLKNWGGYRTAMTGKWHIGGKIPRKGTMELDKLRTLTAPSHDWSRPLIGGPQEIGFDYSYITTSGIQAKPYSFFRDGYVTSKPSDIKLWTKGSYRQDKGMSIIKRPGEGDVNWDSTAYNQIVVNETIDFIDDHQTNHPNKPFFAYVALGAVHGPHSPPDTYLDGTPVSGEYPTPHMDMLLEMDKSVGSLVDAIDEKGLRENTIIIFTSDNGGVMPANDSAEYGHYSHGPLRGAKGDIFEGGTRVPLVVSWKNKFWNGVKRDHYVSLSDIYATLCELVGVGVPTDSAQDSVSFAKYLYAKKNTDGLRKFLSTWTYHPKLGFRTAEAILYQNLKAIRHIDINTGERTWELYDLEKDIGEKNNLSKDPQYDKVKRQMFRRLTLTGPCPNRDRKKPLVLRHGPKMGQSVTCDFFNDKSNCATYFIDGERFCQSKCSRRQWICQF